MDSHGKTGLNVIDEEALATVYPHTLKSSVTVRTGPFVYIFLHSLSFRMDSGDTQFGYSISRTDQELECAYSGLGIVMDAVLHTFIYSYAFTLVPKSAE